MKKLISVLLVFVFVLSLTPTAWAADIYDSGSCGEHITWTLDTDGVLIVSGYGPMTDYSETNPAPWIKHKDTNPVRTAIFNEGITTIGAYAFDYIWYGTPYLTSVSLPSTLVKIGDYAFGANIGLENIKLPNNLNVIGKAAFDGCWAMKSIRLPVSIQKIERWALDFGYDSSVEIYFEGTEDAFKAVIDEDYYENLTTEYVVGHYVHKPATIYYENKQPPLPSNQPSDWAKKEVEKAISLGLVPSEIQNYYRQPIARLDTVKLVVNLLEIINGTTIDNLLIERGLFVNTNTFTDTNDNKVLSASTLGIINGMKEGEFAPYSTLTRAQAAAIINSIANVQGIATDGYTQNFTDTAKHWVAPELGWPVANKIIKGVGQNKFDPDGQLTVEQAILLIYRTYTTLI